MQTKDLKHSLAEKQQNTKAVITAAKKVDSIRNYCEGIIIFQESKGLI